jgi:hypothetical protein
VLKGGRQIASGLCVIDNQRPMGTLLMPQDNELFDRCLAIISEQPVDSFVCNLFVNPDTQAAESWSRDSQRKSHNRSDQGNKATLCLSVHKDSCL